MEKSIKFSIVESLICAFLLYKRDFQEIFCSLKVNKFQLAIFVTPVNVKWIGAKIS